MDQAEFEQLWATAHAGAASAQETLADVFASAGKAEQARQWLVRAVAAARPSAVTRLGLWEITGFGGPSDLERGLGRILACAQSGDAEAAHTAAILFCGGVGAPRDRAQGLRWLVRATELGHVRATAQLGLLVGAQSNAGANLLRIAGAKGSVVAMYALGRAHPQRDEAAFWTRHAVDAGHPLAKGVATAGETPRLEQVLEPRWTALVDAVDYAWVDVACNRRLQMQQPHIELLDDFLPLDVCEYVIGMAAPMLSRGKVVDTQGDESVSEERSNAVMNFGLADSDFVLELINNKTARAVELPPENAEGLGVLHYRTGDSYTPHVDYLADTPENSAQLAARGQRVTTLLVYLNQDFDGGETAFPRLDVSFKPPAGSALIFHNVDAQARTDPHTLHTGRPPTQGEKWLISKWFRSKALRPGAG